MPYDDFADSDHGDAQPGPSPPPSGGDLEGAASDHAEQRRQRRELHEMLERSETQPDTETRAARGRRRLADVGDSRDLRDLEHMDGAERKEEEEEEEEEEEDEVEKVRRVLSVPSLAAFENSAMPLHALRHLSLPAAASPQPVALQLPSPKTPLPASASAAAASVSAAPPPAVSAASGGAPGATSTVGALASPPFVISLDALAAHPSVVPAPAAAAVVSTPIVQPHTVFVPSGPSKSTAAALPSVAPGLGFDLVAAGIHVPAFRQPPPRILSDLDLLGDQQQGKAAHSPAALVRSRTGSLSFAAGLSSSRPHSPLSFASSSSTSDDHAKARRQTLPLSSSSYSHLFNFGFASPPPAADSVPGSPPISTASSSVLADAATSTSAASDIALPDSASDSAGLRSLRSLRENVMMELNQNQDFQSTLSEESESEHGADVDESERKSEIALTHDVEREEKERQRFANAVQVLSETSPIIRARLQRVLRSGDVSAQRADQLFANVNANPSASAIPQLSLPPLARRHSLSEIPSPSSAAHRLRRSGSVSDASLSTLPLLRRAVTQSQLADDLEEM